MNDAVIGIIEDRAIARTDLKNMDDDLKSEQGNHSTEIPDSFNETERLFLFNNLDGLLIDFNLALWDLSKHLIKRVKEVGPVRDGIDLAHLAFRLFKKAKDAIYIYSSEADLKDPRYLKKLDELPFTPRTLSKLERYEDIKQEYRILIEKAEKVRSANPLFQLPDFADKTSINHRIHAFKSIYFNSAAWLDCHFDAVGDHSWVVLGGHQVEMDAYGDILEGGRSRGFNIKGLKKYFDINYLKELARRRRYFPFMLWNTRKPEFVEQQFKLAGPRLVHIPDVFRSFFGVSMARPCARLFVEERDPRALLWCKELDEIGKVEVTKVIYKTMLGKTSGMEDFQSLAQQLELPQIVDILEGTVLEVNEKESRAVVQLEPGRSRAPFNEVFDLNLLKQGHVQFTAQRFDYTVYKQPRGDISVNVEPIYDEDRTHE